MTIHNLEKPLFQIAVERIVERFVKLPTDDREQVFLTLMAAANASGNRTAVAHDAAQVVLPILFPELIPPPQKRACGG